MKTNSPNYQKVRDQLEQTPVIETHEHYTGITEPVDNVLSFLLTTYYRSDFLTGSLVAEAEEQRITDLARPFPERFAAFEQIYRRSCHTAYADAMRRGLKIVWGIEQIDRPSIERLAEKLKGRNQQTYADAMAKAGIKAMIVDLDNEPFVLQGSKRYTEQCRFAFSLPAHHNINGIKNVQTLAYRAGMRITTLDDYVTALEVYLKKCLDFGIVCIKDQTAYRRIICYENAPRAAAEEIFNQIIANPRTVFGDDRTRVLDDWLFHAAMRLAGKYQLPVQIHTGHMAGVRNEISKTNAVHLTSVIEMYPEIQFDLFHGNWPYMGELLFLAKNYPNVTIDLCWAQAIDPLYSIELMKRALVTVPHKKVMAYGGDTGFMEWDIGHLDQARDNMACALADMIDNGWLGFDEAREIAADWLYNNPNELFRLGLPVL